MTEAHKDADKSSSNSGLFPQTRWSLVLQAKNDQTNAAHEALSELCQLYWYPVYCLVRSKGYSPEDAEDHCQGFFQQLLSKRLFERAEARKGKLRSFLLNALKDHLVDQKRKSSAQKRGGGVKPLSIDEAEAEERYSLEPVEKLSPDALFDRAWAESVLARALKDLESAYAAEGKAEMFAKMQVYMSGNDADGHVPLAEELSMNATTLRVSVHRMRKRYRKLLEHLIAETVESPKDLAEEIQHLLTLFSP